MNPFAIESENYLLLLEEKKENKPEGAMGPTVIESNLSGGFN
jgi:hypothetical protein